MIQFKKRKRKKKSKSIIRDKSHKKMTKKETVQDPNKSAEREDIHPHQAIVTEFIDFKVLKILLISKLFYTTIY